MGDEPRRSGRSTKGQHSKIADEAAQTPEAPKPKNKGKSNKKAKVIEYNINEGIRDSDNEFIRCVCGVFDEDEDGRDMLSCEKCDGWQHNDCIGYPRQELELEGYNCFVCRPDDHKDLLAILRQGKDAWRVWIEKRQEDYANGAAMPTVGKKGRGGRPSAGKQAAKQEVKQETKQESPAATTPAPSTKATDSGKRKHTADSSSNGSATKSRGPANQMPKPEDASSKRRKTSAAPEQSKAASSDSDRSPVQIADLPNASRRKLAEELKKTILTQVQELSDTEAYLIPEGETVDTVGERFAVDIEHAIFKNFAGNPPTYSGEYKKKWSSINFNLGKNVQLMLRLLEIKLTPDNLSLMSTDEMASEELQEERAEMKRKADEQAILPTDSGPRMRRTHKGDELIEEHTQFSNEGAIVAPIRRRESELDGEAGSPTTKTEHADGSAASPNRERRPSSALPNTWQSIQSPTAASQPTFVPPPQQQINPAAEQKQTAEIDRLLNQDEDDTEEYTPAEVVLNVSVDMPVGETKNSIAKFTGSAKHVAGGEISARMPMSQLFPDNGQSVVIAGRIKTQLADDYVSNLHAANDTDVVVWQLKTTEHTQFDHLFNYLATRERYGVGRAYREYIRDIYIVPIEQGTEELPMFLKRLAYCDLPTPTAERVLLLTYILRWEPNTLPGQATQPPGIATAAASAPRGSSAMSPINAVTPFAHQDDHQALPQQFRADQAGTPSAFAPAPAQAQAFPGNPYAQSQDMAREIMGPLYNTPVVQKLLSLSESLSAEQLENLKHIMEKYPNTRTDWEAFQEQVRSKNNNGVP